MGLLRYPSRAWRSLRYEHRGGLRILLQRCTLDTARWIALWIRSGAMEVRTRFACLPRHSLTFSIKAFPLKCAGHMNIPDGEIDHGARKTTSNGTIAQYAVFGAGFTFTTSSLRVRRQDRRSHLNDNARIINQLDIAKAHACRRIRHRRQPHITFPRKIRCSTKRMPAASTLRPAVAMPAQRQ